jgi:hypothetical protein
MRRIIWLFGVATGLFIGSNFFLNIGGENIDFERGELLGFILMVLAFGIALFYSTKLVKDRHLNGEIDFSKAFISGFFIILIASVIYALMWEIYFTIHGDAYVDNYLEKMKAAFKDSDLGQLDVQTRIRNRTAIMESYRESFIVRFGLTVAEAFPIGIGMALVNSIYYSFLGRKVEDAQD